MAAVVCKPYVFVSYASVDRERVLPVVDHLEAAGVTVWIDREGIHGGANYAQVINDAIQGAAALLLMASPASLASRNVKQELALGWRYETPYLPLLLDRVTIPGELAYWLEGCQWIEILDRAEDEWLGDVAQALEHYGVALQLSTERDVVPPADRERPLLVGREREQGVLRTHLDAMLNGRGSTVLVGGEAGIGKTTLVDDLSAQAEEHGALVLWGHAYDLSVTPPYGPWLEIFRRYQPLAPGWPPTPTFFASAEALARIGSRETLFTETCEFFTAVAAQRPLMLVLDDLHWFDQSSLDFFRFLARQVADQSILLVATYRSDELTRRHPLSALMPLLVREAGAERLQVRPLDATGHRAIIQSRYDLVDADQARLEDYLAAHAEGNPLYAGELLRTLEEEGVLAQHADGWVLGDLQQVLVPALLRQVIERRLARLDEESLRILGVASVIGQTVLLEVWATVGEVEEDVLLDLSEHVEEARLLDWMPGGEGVHFSHALIREALYAGISPVRRRRLHRQVAEALVAAPRPDPDTVAYHFQQAGDPRAIDWLVQAGERAQELYAPAAAIEHFTTAETLADLHARPLPGTVYRARGQAQSLVGNFEAARDDFETVRTLAKQAGDGRAEWQALLDLGMLWASRDYAQTGQFFQQALALARTMDIPDLTAHSLNRVGNWHVNSEQTLEALGLHQEALAIFQRLDDRAGIAATSDLLGLASYFSGDLIQGSVHFRRAVDLFRAADDREGLASSLVHFAMRGGIFMTDTMVVDKATLADCTRDAEEAVEIARSIGWRSGESFALWVAGCCLASAGHYQRALDAVTSSIEIAEKIEHLQWLASTHCVAGTIYFGLLMHPEAQDLLERAVAYARDTGSQHWMNSTSGLLASLLVARGDLSRAEAVLDAVFDADTPMESMGQRLAWCARVELALAQGDPDTAVRLLDRMLATSPNASAAQPILRFSVLRADALTAMNQFDLAEEALRAAQGVADVHAARPWSWRIHLALGLLHHRRHDGDGAAAEFALARTIIEELAAETPPVQRQSFLDGATRLFPDP